MPLPFSERRVLLTGAGGSIGAALAQEILKQKPSSLFLLDHSEGNLHQLGFALSLMHSGNPPKIILGDIRETAVLEEIFEEERPEIVLHTAAYKHVPLMESHVLAAVRNNALGTHQLAKMAAASDAQSFVMVSTDKAVEPRSVMGATKRVAELALLRWASAECSMRAVRLGNVLGSHGSVVPTFLAQIAAGGPVTVTHPEATRYFFSIAESVELIMLAAALAGESGIYVPEPGQPVRIADLAKQLIREANAECHIPIVFTGLRPGDKLHEKFVSVRESVENAQSGKLKRMSTPAPTHAEFDAAIHALEASLEDRDVGGALEGLCRLVPDYCPSETARHSRARQGSGAR
jgi:FlaA1/EpsC-like NDP-sugar epimerase